MEKQTMQCKCEYHELEKGDTLYVYNGWDGGIEFNAIRNIKYCPICGKELPEEFEFTEEL